MKTFEQFRHDWVLNPSKEMIVESEIVDAYKKYAIEAIFEKHHEGYGSYNKDEIVKELLSLSDVVGQSEQLKKFLHYVANASQYADRNKMNRDAEELLNKLF